jgi:hypothetical protein
MPEPTKKQIDKSILSCRWVEEPGFQVAAIKGQVKAPESPVLSDTAFLQKMKSPLRPSTYPPQ